VPEAGNSITADLHARLDALRARLAAVPATRVLFVVWTEPLISVGKETFVADALRLADAASIVDSNQDWPQIGLEEVARLQPEYLVFAASHFEAGTRDFESLADRPGWRILDAVRSHHVAVVSDAVIRPAPRIVSAIEDLARQLHPAAFQEVPEPKASTKSALPRPNASAANSSASIVLDTPPATREIACAR